MIAAELLEALKEIEAGLANTGSVRGQWMTKIMKSDAWLIASKAISKAEAEIIDARRV